MTDNLAWSQLKKIDVEKEKMVKRKGKYSYISWAMAVIVTGKLRI